MDGNSPNITDWVNSVEGQGEISKFDGAVKWSSNKKNFKIKKVNQDDKVIEGVTFEVFNTKEEAKTERNAKGYKASIGSAVSNDKGDVIFENVPLYYQFYIKETKVPKGYAKSDEIIPVYRDNGVRFLGEMIPEKMKFEGKKRNGKKITENNPGKEKNNINTYLQSLVDGGTPFNNDTNWLVYNDNGTEKLVSKKPLKYGISWNSLYNAGVVFGEDGIKDLDTQEKRNSIFIIKTSYGEYSDTYNSIKEGNKPDGNVYEYKPQYVNINGKTYIVRLIRAYNDNKSVNDKSFDSQQYANTKGSEWNRLILPSIGVDGNEIKVTSHDDYDGSPYGRYGYYSQGATEANMPSLANYSWWKDFCGNAKLSNNMYERHYGVGRLAQDSNGSEHRAYRGKNDTDSGAAYSLSCVPKYSIDFYGWLVVLEEVK